MGAVSLKAAQIKNIQAYDLIRNDTAHAYAQIVNRATGQQLLVREIRLGREFASIPELESYLQRTMLLQHENVVQLKDYYIDQAMRAAACLYEFPLRSLSDERAQRQMFNTPYKENQIWSVVQGIVLGMNYLNRNGLRNQALRLQTIMLSTGGTIRIADPAITCAESNYRMCANSTEQFVPLAPSQIDSLASGRNKPSLTTSKDDVFCAGVVLLELALIGARYNLQFSTQREAYRASILQGIQICGSRYSSEFLAVLGLMLEFDEKERFDWGDLVEFVEGSKQKPQNESEHSKTATFPAGIDSISSRASFGRTQPNNPTAVPIRTEQMRNVAPEQPRNSLNHRGGSLPIDGKLLRYGSTIHQPKPALNIVKPQSQIVQPQNRLNHTVSQAFFQPRKEEPPAEQPTSAIRTNRILASNINRERSLGRNASPITDPIRYVQPIHSGKIASNRPNPITFQQGKQVPVAFTFLQQGRQAKPQTAASNFVSIIEQTKDSQLTDNLPSYNAATSINSIIVQERDYDLLGNAVRREKRILTEDDMKIVPKTFVQAGLIPAEAPPAIPEGLLEKRITNVKSQKELTAIVEAVKHAEQQLNQEEPVVVSARIEVEPVITYQQLQASILNSQTETDPTTNKVNIAEALELRNAPTSTLEKLKDANIVSIESKIIEKLPSFSSTGSRNWYRPAENPTATKAMSVAYDNMIESKEWANLFKKTDQKVSVEVQTSPVRSKSPEKNPAKRMQTEQDKISDVRQKNLYESSKTVKATYQAPIKHEVVQPVPQSPRKILPHYEGETLRGFRHGFGRYYFEDGGYYEGQWTFNRMQGKGKLYYANGKIAYEGIWSQDQIHGYGKLYNETPRFIESFDYKDFTRLGNYWSTYEGNFEFDQKNGTGTLTLPNGETYSGGFEADQVHGEGIFRGRNRAVHGIWERGLLKTVL